MNGVTWVKNILHTTYTKISNDFIRSDLSTNKYAPAENVIKTLRESIPRISAYPDRNWSLLTKKIESYTGISDDHMLTTNGLKKAIISL
ncbi:MAG: hypothetical protein HY364_00685 [Candidatus Aenigmarchaeota archaeon]|nr:hypothetical protein [Candidatus Aenigmarchaeota archaeon]